jgi:hypothetical protein
MKLISLPGILVINFSSFYDIYVSLSSPIFPNGSKYPRAAIAMIEDVGSLKNNQQNERINIVKFY